jgi:uncharacterized membrane protein
MGTGGMKLDPRDEVDLKEMIRAIKKAFVLLILLFPFILIIAALLGG